MTAAATPIARRTAGLEEELRRVRGLVSVRNLLRERGATPSELRQIETAIGQARARLAASAKRAAANE